MAETTFYLYPDSNAGPYTFMNTTSFTGIDDAFDAVNCPTSGDRISYNPSGDGSTSRDGSGSWGVSAPTSGVSINWIRLHIAGMMRARAGGSWVASARFVGAVRPAGSSTYYIVAPTIVDDGGSAVVTATYQITTIPDRNTNTGGWAVGTGCCHWYHHYATNPVTASAWTVAELQALIVSLVANTTITTSPASVGMLRMPAASGASTRDIRVGGIFVEVNADTAAASIEEKRGMGTAYLRLLRNPTEPVTVALPLEYADADVGDTIGLASQLGPSEDGLGWGVKAWQRRYGMVLSKSIDVSAKVVRAVVLELTGFYCDLWFPAISDLAYTEEGQGVPYLDGGGGRTMARITKAYTQRQENDELFVEVPVDKERWSPKGFGAFRGTRQRILNNSFSQGSGSTFTSWTNSTSGAGTVNESTSDILFDSTGHRRSVNLKTTTANAGFAGLFQATATLTSGANGRIHIVSKRVSRTASGLAVYRLRRESDGNFWRDSDSTWQATAQNNPLDTEGLSDGEIAHTYSHSFDTAASAYTLWVYVVDNAVAANAGEEQVYYAALYSLTNPRSASGRRPPFVTTTAEVTEGGDFLEIASPISAPAFNITQGTAMAVVEPQWEHEDLETSIAYSVWVCEEDANDRDLVFYTATNSTSGSWNFRRRIGATNYVASIATSGASLPNFGDVFKVAARWQGTGGEHGNADHTIALMVQQNATAPVLATGTAVVPSAANRTLSIGSKSVVPDHECDAYISRVEFVPLVLTDDELFRRMGI